MMNADAFYTSNDLVSNLPEWYNRTYKLLSSPRGSAEQEVEKMISVIVPVYNVEKYLNKCVESILRQSFCDFELILVDDGSPDQCGALCDEWAKADQRVQVIHKPNGGLSDARNAGIDRARGDWLCFVDSDDWIAEDMLETLHSLARENDAEMACCNFVQLGEDGVQVKELAQVRSGVCTQDDYWAQSFCANIKMYYNVVWNKLYKRSLFDRVRFPVGLINEDAYIMYDLVSQCGKIAITDKIGYYYLIRSNSIMRRTWSLKNLTSAEAYLTRTERFIELGKWRFAEETLAHAIHELLLNEYGEGGKKSAAYKAVKKRARSLYGRLFSHLSPKRKVSSLLFFLNEPLARAANKTISAGKRS